MLIIGTIPVPLPTARTLRYSPNDVALPYGPCTVTYDSTASFGFPFAISHNCSVHVLVFAPGFDLATST
eukprot:31287-Pelagococcus_subviridis.AAC.7